MHCVARALLAAVLCAISVNAHAASLPVRDLNPLLSGYELPPALPSHHDGDSRLSAGVAVGNISLDQSAAHDTLLLDAELQHWQFDFTRSSGDTLNLRIELPYVRVSGGHLDHFIESFHGTFGLPNGNRDAWPGSRLLILHTYNGNADYRLAHSAQGIGDLALRLGWSPNALSTSTYNNTLWFTLKLPTGDANRLAGSGAADIALSLSASQQLSSHFVTQQQVSVSLLGQGKRLREQQETVVWSGSVGLDAMLTSHWSAVLQFDGHTKVFATDLRALGNALQFSLGAHYATDMWKASLLVSEDIAVDTAPDVQFQFNLQRRF
ncbi:MAG: DUF3187 family protein [Steroidobacteraceae bacterium]